jgi:hypothetical protein
MKKTSKCYTYYGTCYCDCTPMESLLDLNPLTHIWITIHAFHVLTQSITGMKTTKSIRFSNQNKNKWRLNSKFKSWNKKNKNKNTTCAKSKSNKVLLQRRNKTRLWQENVPKIGVEQIKGNGEFYLYLYILATLLKELPNYMWPMFIHVCPCVPMCELWMN